MSNSRAVVRLVDVCITVARLSRVELELLVGDPGCVRRDGVHLFFLRGGAHDELVERAYHQEDYRDT